ADAIRGGGSVSNPAHVRNVTAIATGAGSAGISVSAQSVSIPMSGCGDDDEALTVDNAIVRGVEADLSTETSGPCGSPSAAITVSYSNFRTSQMTGSGASVIPGTGNQTTPEETDDSAIFADTTLYHQLETAPTRNAGGADPTDSSFVDPDGHARVSEGQVDIGSDEVPG